jgi:hypothetical protein
MELDSGLAESTSMYPELTRPVPRNVRMTGTGWANVVLLMVILGAAATWAAYMGNAALHASAKRDTLRAGAAEATGQITREWTSGRGSSTQHIRYEFEVAGTIYSGESIVPGSIWKSLKHAAGVKIKYSTADPRINHPAGWEDSTFQIWIPLIGPVMLSCVGLALVRLLLTQRRLVAEGLPAVAYVTERVKGSKGSITLKYEFRTEGGEMVKGACYEEKRQEVGSTIFVVYLSGKPGTSRPYPFETFKVDG